MPKRKQQAPPSSESEEPEASGSEPAASNSSSDDGDEFPSGADDSSSESSDDEAGEAFEQIDVDFGFFCPQEKDFQGLRTLLQGYLDGQQWACSELADAIIRQARRGSAAMLCPAGLDASVESCLGDPGEGRMHVPSGRRQPPPPAACRVPAVRFTALAALCLPAMQGDSVGVGSVIKCGEEDDPIGVSTVLPLSSHGSAKPLQELRTFLLAAAGDCRQRLEKVGSSWLGNPTAVGLRRAVACMPAGQRCMLCLPPMLAPRSSSSRCHQN